MELLKKKILEEGNALSENILKVDSFLNHQVDANLMDKIGMEFASHFKNKHIDKIVTIESSGIAPAILTAKYLNVPLLILKKQQSSILKDELYQTTVHSFTKSVDYMLTASKNYLKEGENNGREKIRRIILTIKLNFNYGRHQSSCRRVG